jgi:hypothetical protein
MRCQSCGFDNLSGSRFCAGCAKPMSLGFEAVPVPGEDGVFYCAKHKKEATRVTCGRCEKPICTKCTVIGPAGVRCRDCARNKVPVRARGVFHDASRGVAGAVPRQVWYIAIFYVFIGFFRDLFGPRG